MAVMLIIIYLYYSVAVYIHSTDSTTTINLYDQVDQEYPVYKRQVGQDSEDAYVEDNYYENDPGNSDNGDDADIPRKKRDNVTTPATPSSPAGKTKKNKGTQKPNKGNATSNANTNNTQEEEVEEEEVLDFKLSNSFVDSIHAEADQNKLKEPLGLCRKNINITTPDMNITLFPVEQAQEIITCINGILANQSKKHLCIELNEEMSAYLKWLILTGDSKERKKQIKFSAYRDDFLFASTCGATMGNMEGLTNLPIAPRVSGGQLTNLRIASKVSGEQQQQQQQVRGSKQGNSFRVDTINTGHNEMVDIASGPELTTCAPVKKKG